MGLLTERINNKLEKSNLINKHALNREPVRLSEICMSVIEIFWDNEVFMVIRNTVKTGES